MCFVFCHNVKNLNVPKNKLYFLYANYIFITFILKSTFLDSSPKRFSTSFIFCCSFLVWPDSVAYEIILVLGTITKSRIKHLELCFCYANSDESLALQSFCSIIKADMFQYCDIQFDNQMT